MKFLILLVTIMAFLIHPLVGFLYLAIIMSESEKHEKSQSLV